MPISLKSTPGRRLAARTPTGWATGLIVMAAVMIAALAIVFSNSDHAVRIGDDSEALLRSGELMSAATAVRATIDQALVFAAAEESGLTSVEETDAVVRDGLTLAANTETYLELLTEADPDLDPAVATASRALITTSQGILELVDARRIGEASDAARTSLTAAYDGLTNILQPYREQMAAVVAAQRGSAGRVAQAASFGVAFLIPAIAILTFRSVSRRRQKQADLERSLEREQELRRARDEMIANLSHELRTPLTAIYGFAVAMREEGFADRRIVGDTTDLIISEAGRLGRMVEDLLVAAKSDADSLGFQLGEVDIVREIDEALTPFHHEYRRPEVVVEPGTVVADRLRIRHVVTNLVANAIDHGGPTIAINGVVRAGWYHCSVIDDGEGVPDELVDRLFSRYVHEGEQPLLAGTLGLGLAVARTLLHQMGGDIRYERKEGLTIFHFRLPLVQSEETQLVAGAPV